MPDLRSELIEVINGTRFGLCDDLLVGRSFKTEIIEKIADRILADGWSKGEQ